MVAALTGTMACQRGERQSPIFELLPAGRTGLSFENRLPEAADFNILNYLYYYNGGGVAVGDIDNDGLQDLYLSSNLESNRLYRNLGDYRFEDVTDRAGVPGPPGWKTGVTMADVNGDGHVDLYVSAVSYLGQQGHNILYLNNGNGTFADKTAEYGLEQRAFGTQAAFFDYDLDGDLDVYLLNHSTHVERGIDPFTRGFGSSPAADRLLRNEGGRFTDVTQAAGIADGAGAFGLGVIASDVSGDGCPDVYVANDFQENDYLWINNCNGTFTESIARATSHTSRFSMGVDAADINNDGLLDVFVADMQPEREEILKTAAGPDSPSLFELRQRAGYQPQYPRNTLQLNRGGLRFSEIAQLSGVYASDWSWAPLFADFDNDGRKDLFVSSGIYRRPNDMDYISYIGNEAVQSSLARGIDRESLALLERMPQIRMPNHVWRNEGGLRFSDRSKAWGIADPAGFSSGAAYVDLNNTGALDLVVNRINAPVTVYRNRVHERAGAAHLTVTLQGSGGNRAGVGAKVRVKADGVWQLFEQTLTRGFQSSVDPRIHVGLGAAARADSVVVVWPSRRASIVTSVASNAAVTLRESEATDTAPDLPNDEQPVRFENASGRLGAPVAHEENAFLDYNREPFMPHLLSTEGPALAVADVNGDGLDDLFVGGAKWQAGALLVQRRDGTFARQVSPAFQADSLSEDVDAVFADVDGDGDQDLFVVSGGNEFFDEAEALRDRLYVNEGKGTFRRNVSAIPPLYENGGCVAAADYDRDGDIDLFVGTRVVARAYGKRPRSSLLRNEGGGRFVDVTQQVAPALGTLGMVASAAWVDADGDGALDLVAAGEWTPVQVLRQTGGTFVDATAAMGFGGTEGWWNGITVGDLNGDSRPDLILGNLGLNSYLRATAHEPARLYVGDFMQTGAIKQVLTFYKHGTSYPVAGRDDFVRSMPALRPRYPSYKSFGASTIRDVLPPAELARAEVREARTFASMVAVNQGSGTFKLSPLPIEAQFAPVYAAAVLDVNGDGRADAVTAGNFFGATPLFGRYDATFGQVLLGDGSGEHYAALRPSESGLTVTGEVRALVPLRGADGARLIAVARTGSSLQLWRMVAR